MEHRHVRDLPGLLRARRPRRGQRHAGPAGPAAPATSHGWRRRGAPARAARRPAAPVVGPGPAGASGCGPASASLGPDAAGGPRRGRPPRRRRRGAPASARSTRWPSCSALGEVPLPPYITVPLADPERYQTVYAARPGSVAAPTAGLHLTAERPRRAGRSAASRSPASSWSSGSTRSSR